MIELTLQITGTIKAGYEITCRRSKRGVAVLKPTDKIPLDSFQPGQALHPETIAGTLGHQAQTLKQFQTIGTAIAKTFLEGTAGKLFFKERAALSKEHDKWVLEGGRGPETILRTYLQIDPPELNILPWEWCRWDNSNLFFDRRFPLIRMVGKELAKAGSFDDWPVRILAVIGDADGGDRDIKAPAEIRTLRWILAASDHSFDIDVFNAPAESQAPGPIEALKAKLHEFKPHIVHFAGHAWFDPLGLQIGGPNYGWRPEDIRTFFQGETWRPRLIFLNACQTAKPSPTGDSFASALANCTLSMVTMTSDLQGQDAGDCAGKIYAAIADGEPLDQAIVKARAALGPTRLAAYYPVFTAMVSPSALVFAEPPRDRVKKELVEALADRSEIKYFVDRAASRRTLLDSIRTGRKTIAVVGDSNNGKTWFLTTCLRCLVWRGYEVIYVDLRKRTSWNVLLRSILAGGEFNIALPIDPAARRTVENIIGLEANPVDLIQTGLLPSAVAATLNAIRPRIADSAPKPVILMLDHLRQASDSDRSIATDAMSFLNYFFKPVQESDGHVRLVLSFEDESILKTWAADGLVWTKVDLKDFPSSEIEEITRDWVHAKHPARLEKAETLIPQITQSRAPRELANMWDQILKGGP